MVIVAFFGMTFGKLRFGFPHVAAQHAIIPRENNNRAIINRVRTTTAAVVRSTYTLNMSTPVSTCSQRTPKLSETCRMFSASSSSHQDGVDDMPDCSSSDNNTNKRSFARPAHEGWIKRVLLVPAGLKRKSPG